MTISRGAGQSGAECDLSGVIAINASWNEDIYFFDADGAAVDISDLDWSFQFRTSPDATSADVTLSTVAGTLTVEDDNGSVSSILRISADPGTFTNYEGDMIADLIAVDADDVVTLYAHGVVTFANNPVAV